jgi:hypothetical protein
VKSRIARCLLLLTGEQFAEKRGSAAAQLPSSTPSAPRAMAAENGRFSRADPPPQRDRDRESRDRVPSGRDVNPQHDLPPRRDRDLTSREPSSQRDPQSQRDFQARRDQPPHGGTVGGSGAPGLSLQSRLGDMGGGHAPRSPLDDRGRPQERRANDSPNNEERNARKRNLDCKSSCIMTMPLILLMHPSAAATGSSTPKRIRIHRDRYGDEPPTSSGGTSRTRNERR